MCANKLKKEEKPRKTKKIEAKFSKYWIFEFAPNRWLSDTCCLYFFGSLLHCNEFKIWVGGLISDNCKASISEKSQKNSRLKNK